MFNSATRVVNMHIHVQAIDTQLCINGFYVHTGKAMTISENNGKLRR